MMNRRAFVGVLGCLTAAGGLGLGFTVFQRRQVAIAELAPATARMMRGAAVELQAADGGRLQAVVESVHAKRERSRRGVPDTEQISLLLKTARSNAQAGTYQLQAEDVVLEGLYFTAVGPEGQQRRLEAVINRIV